MRSIWLNILGLVSIGVAAALVISANLDRGNSNAILNVSYDPTRELFQELNPKFVEKYRVETGKRVEVKQSHGGSARQARAVIDGTPADVVSLALVSDVDALRKRGLIAPNWAQRLPHESHAFTSTIVFVVRRGNPKKIKDWPDLVQPDVSVITPNPKTSGNGKLSLLAAWGSVIFNGGKDAQARAYLRRLYQHVPVLATGARESTTTFAGEKVGDVHLTWENEALMETESSNGELQIIYPPVSILAEPPVAWVDANVNGTPREVYAKAYLQFLFSDEAQEIIARHGYRPVNQEIFQKHAKRFPPVNMFPITLIAGNWDEIQLRFFDENGIFDQIYKPRTAR